MINDMHENTMIVPDVNGKHLQIPLIDYDLHSYITLSFFKWKLINVSSHNFIQAFWTCKTSLSWKKLKSVADKTQKQICVHADISDVKLPIEQNKLFSLNVEKYLTQLSTITLTFAHVLSPVHRSRRCTQGLTCREDHDDQLHWPCGRGAATRRACRPSFQLWPFRRWSPKNNFDGSFVVAICIWKNSFLFFKKSFQRCTNMSQFF